MLSRYKELIEDSDEPLHLLSNEISVSLLSENLTHYQRTIHSCSTNAQQNGNNT